MIRRHTSPSHFHLIPQHAHAFLAGHLAQHVGGSLFTPPTRETILATTMHDAGWPLHDDTPTLNKNNLPRDVFESNRHIALPVWTASADRAEAVHPYAGLLVSLHSLALSVFATTHAPLRHENFDLSHLQDKFAINQFQHAEADRQHRLRKLLNLPTHLPLTYGLSQPGLDNREDQLRSDFRLLQAMDMLSLAICCTTPPAPTTQDVHPHPGSPSLKLTLTRPTPDTLIVDPWPFTVPNLEVQVQAHRLPSTPFDSPDSFHQAYRSAPTDTLSLVISSK